jgi:nicotinamide-nucleotide amidase
VSTGSADEVAALVVARLIDQGRTVAVAESLTGGLVLAALISVPGASAAVRGGVVAYATDLKASLLGVDPELLARVGAVDPDVVSAMVRGARDRLGADYGVATTGVAGPLPADGRPVGTVFVGVCDGTGAVTVEAPPHVDGRSRAEVRAEATRAALGLLLRVLGG